MYLGMMQLICFLLRWSLSLGFTCLDSSSNPVDWYSVYKSPKINTSPDTNIQNGLGQFYLDVNSPAWKLSTGPISSLQQAVGRTLSAAIYTNKDKNDYMYMLYNDDYKFESVESNLKTGHTKGVVAFNKTSGFWLIHSVPGFPPVQAKGYSYPQSGAWNGQTFLCVSFKYQELGRIDLYKDLVALELKQSLLVQTWLNGKGGKLGSNCSGDYKVLKVTNIKLPGDLEFSTSRDHSKWAISLEDSVSTDLVLKFQKLEPWTCVGDINRMRSQFERGGGTLCLLNDSVWAAFRDLISGYNSCPPPHSQSFNSLVSN